ncbi:MAG TPA: FHA domain-containing protein, partial [Tepidisphaeraceae bacterium]|nr:FHA domain-containing protein [Tepidisphaeraceae bacterium]
MLKKAASETMASSGQQEKTRDSFPSLVPIGQHAGKPAIALSRSVMVAGNSKANRIQLLSDSVSHNHTIFIVDDSGTYFRDLVSRTHTILNGRVSREGFLKAGDAITIGSFVFHFEEPATGGQSRHITPAPAALDIVDAEIPLPIDSPTTIIGRRTGVDVRLVEESVSTAHAIIFEQDGKHHIRDLSSRTGTFVNGRKAHQVELNFGDEIRIGETVMKFVPYVVELEESDQLDQSVALLDEEPLEIPDRNAETTTLTPVIDRAPIPVETVDEAVDEAEQEEVEVVEPEEIAEEIVEPVEPPTVPAARNVVETIQTAPSIEDRPLARAPDVTKHVDEEHPPVDLETYDDGPVVPVARRTPIVARPIDVPSEVLPYENESETIPPIIPVVESKPTKPLPAETKPIQIKPVIVEPVIDEVVELEPIKVEADDADETLSEDDLLDELNEVPPVPTKAPPVVPPVVPVDEKRVEPELEEELEEVDEDEFDVSGVGNDRAIRLEKPEPAKQPEPAQPEPVQPEPIQPEPAAPKVESEMDRLMRSLAEAANRPLDPEIADLENRARTDVPTEEVDLKVEDPLAGVPQPISALARRARAIADLLDVNEDIEIAAEEESKAIAEVLTG